MDVEDVLDVVVAAPGDGNACGSCFWVFYIIVLCCAGGGMAITGHIYAASGLPEESTCKCDFAQLNFNGNEEPVCNATVVVHMKMLGVEQPVGSKSLKIRDSEMEGWDLWGATETGILKDPEWGLPNQCGCSNSTPEFTCFYAEFAELAFLSKESHGKLTVYYLVFGYAMFYCACICICAMVFLKCT